MNARNAKTAGETGVVSRWLRRTRAWLSGTLYANRWYAALAAVALLWQLWLMLGNPLLNFHLLYNRHLLALSIACGLVMTVGLVFKPDIASCAMIVLSALWIAVMRYETFAWFAGGVLIAIAVLAYIRPRWAAIATAAWLVCLGLAFAVRSQSFGSADAYGWICALLAACAVAACAIGMLMGLKGRFRSLERKQADRLRAEQELARKRRNETIARNIHDSLTGNLSYIALLAQRELARQESDGDADADADASARAAWLGVERNATDALKGVRKVIGLLDADDANGGPEGMGERSFEGIMRLQEPRLEDLDIRGRTVVVDQSDGSIDGERMEAAYALVEELYANLLRHCAPGDDAYFMRIGLTADGVTIAEANAIRPSDGDASGPLPDSGTGLIRHARAIQRLGGTCDYRSDGGEWLLSAFIPNATE
ncbi:histidine kinase [Bifidobacterium vespertilionis]|uniref:histidine kinase n=1 Tax=Bifidobacterium vespertilionis TaxID=2562524 RepID=A0A5J5E0E4_9BIFI|nr:histidine kinase [Bifidobacterium vespertilionis]KAA8822601.1 hypothetical protein EMO90_01025 [Bifidobacterium vespertilionis]KAA8824114.1 hypothetical protein EM848_03010 [Bifidobacterium vespertilionis]